MRFCVLGSGSKGNSTYVESGETRILIDAGFSGVEVRRRLTAIDVDIATLSAIVVTHEHTDHIRGAGVLSRKYQLPVFANPGTFRAAGSGLKKLFNACEFSPGESFVFQDFKIHPFSISHDAADPVGFIFSNDQRMLGYCTDTGVVSRLMHHRLAGCHGLVLECNHDPEMLKNGPYPQHLKQRVRSKTGHLANADAASFLSAILHDGLEHVVLSHISETNNRPEIAHKVVTKVLHEIREKGGPGCVLPKVSLAMQEQVGEVVTLNGSVV